MNEDIIPYTLEDGNKAMCYYPFFNVYSDLNDYDYLPCCWAQKVRETGKNPNNTLPIDYWDGEWYSTLRKDMLAGNITEHVHDVCKECHRREEYLGSSARTKKKVDWEVVTKNYNQDGTRRNTDEPYLSIALNIYGDHCNLECYECTVRKSTTRTARIKKMDPYWMTQPGLDILAYNQSDLAKLKPDQFNRIVDEICANAKNIVLFQVIGGEPMVMKSHFLILDRLIQTGYAHRIGLFYCTNMTLCNLKQMQPYFDNFRWTDIQWSVDSIGERNEWLRYPTNWKETMKNVREIKRYLEINKMGSISGNVTPSLLSITSFAKTIKFLKMSKLFFEHTTFYNVVVKPYFLQCRHLPNELKEEIVDEVRSISEQYANDLMQPRDPELWKRAIKYCDELDQSRGTDWRSLFPEIAKYA